MVSINSQLQRSVGREAPRNLAEVLLCAATRKLGSALRGS